MRILAVVLVFFLLLSAVESSPPRTDDIIGSDVLRRNKTNATGDANAVEMDNSRANFDGFETFIEGLGKLQDDLNNLDYDWQQKAEDVQPNDTTEQPQAEVQLSNDVQADLSSFLTLIGVLKQIVHSETTTPSIPRTTTTPSSVSKEDFQHLQEAEEVLRNIITAYSDPEGDHDYLQFAQPEDVEESLNDVMNKLTELFNKFSSDMNLPQIHPHTDHSGGPVAELNKSLAILERARLNFQESSDASNHLNSLGDIITELRSISREADPNPAGNEDVYIPSASLDEACSMDRNCELKDEYSRCGDENTCVCKDGYRKQVFPQVGSYCTVYVPVPPTPPVIDPKAPCSFPYVEIAYKMCILPELEQRLTWVDAVDYCRALGLELAYDSVVIKARRYFNDLLGESGTRERWPIWIGGKQETNEAGESHWVWTDGTSVPSFLWQEGKPRTWVDTYSGGLCMIMDGYAQYYPDSLPCHYKRRFVCQRLS